MRNKKTSAFIFSTAICVVLVAQQLGLGVIFAVIWPMTLMALTGLGILLYDSFGKLRRMPDALLSIACVIVWYSHFLTLIYFEPGDRDGFMWFQMISEWSALWWSYGAGLSVFCRLVWLVLNWLGKKSVDLLHLRASGIHLCCFALAIPCVVFYI